MICPTGPVPRHNAYFRPDFPWEGPNMSPDSHEIFEEEEFTDQGNPTTIFAPVIRYQGEPLHASNSEHCFQCETWIQYSGSRFPADGLWNNLMWCEWSWFHLILIRFLGIFRGMWKAVSASADSSGTSVFSWRRGEDKSKRSSRMSAWGRRRTRSWWGFRTENRMPATPRGSAWCTMVVVYALVCL
jgi:hypothetical protein